MRKTTSPVAAKSARAPLTDAYNGDTEQNDKIAQIIRQLIVQAAQLDDSPEIQQNQGQLILLDIEVDGIRCLLLEPIPREPAPHTLVLSPREQEVARMVAKGYPNKTIAAVLDISTWTVGTYVRRIFAKLGVGCRAAMVAKMQELSRDPMLAKSHSTHAKPLS